MTLSTAHTVKKPAMSSPFKSFIRTISPPLKGKTELATVFWPWLLFFLFLDYFIFALRPIIATTEGGAIFGMITFALLCFSLPAWFFCIWKNAKNSENKAWGILARAATFLFAYYAYNRLSFLLMIMTG